MHFAQVRFLTIKVLIADDSAYLRKKIRDILLENELIEVIDCAKNGKEAIEMVRKYNPDVLILDLIMPEINGLDALKVIMDQYPTPTIILSALSPQNMDSSIQALLIGAFDYIIKPGGLGAKELPKFKEELLSKVLLANQSPLKKSHTNLIEKSKKTSLRQEIIDDIFNFGKYINKLSSIQECDEILEEIPIKKEKSEESYELSQSFDDLKKIQYLSEENHRKIEKDQNLASNKDLVEKVSKKVEKKSIISYNKNASIKIAQKSLKDRLKNKAIKKQFSTKYEPIPLKTKNDEILQTNQVKPYKVQEKTISHALDFSTIKNVRINSNIVIIGASVGGVKTINLLLKSIPKNISCPIMIVQHLNANFIENFVSILDKECEVKVKEAENGEFLQNGVVYISPGGKHTEIIVKAEKPCIKTFIGTPVNFCMPSIDVLFISAAKMYKRRVLGILLTGMGVDGVVGLGVIQKFKGKTIVESKETCAVYGMPKNAIKKGNVDKILPNYEISSYIVKFAS